MCQPYDNSSSHKAVAMSYATVVALPAATTTSAAAPKATTTIQIIDWDFLDNFIHTVNKKILTPKSHIGCNDDIRLAQHC
jgi:hypothetical protein